MVRVGRLRAGFVHGAAEPDHLVGDGQVTVAADIAAEQAQLGDAEVGKHAQAAGAGPGNKDHAELAVGGAGGGLPAEAG